VSYGFLAGVKSIGKGVSSAVGCAGVLERCTMRGVIGTRGGGEFWLGVSVGGGSGFMVFLKVGWGFGVLTIGEGASRSEIFLICEFGGVSGQ
jgi:hypothetical protein